MEGHTALKHYCSNPYNVYIKSDDVHYVFTPKDNISLAWVKDEHVDKVLSVTKNCCGNSRKPRFFRASETDVRRWNFGGR